MWKCSEELAWNVLRLLWLVPNSDGVGMLSGWKPIVFLALSFMVSSRMGKDAEEGKSYVTKMSLKDISRPQISASKIGKTSQRTELGGGVLSALVKPTSPMSKSQQCSGVTTSDTTREIIPALTAESSFTQEEACSNTSDSYTDFLLSLSASASDGQQ